MLNLLIVEDNPCEMEYCCNAVTRILKDCMILKAGSGEEALALMTTQIIDVFLIDVELPGINGFRLAELIRSNPNYKLTSIVFISGHKVNQLKIHKKYHHYEYIEKPYSFESFDTSMKSFLNALDVLKQQNEKRPEDTKRKMILLEAKEETILVNPNDILFFETQGRGILLHTKYLNYYDIKMKIDDVIREAGSDYIVRCHKSYGVNIKNVKSIKIVSRRLWNAEFGDGMEQRCEISKTYYQRIYDLFTNREESR